MFIEVIVLSCIGSTIAGDGEPERATFRTYTLDVPRSDPIEIIEGDPLWAAKRSPVKNRQWSTPPTHDPVITHDQEEFEKLGLRDFLTKYAEKLKRDKIADSADDPTANGDLKDEKSWNLLQTHHHNHPYDDRSGWVTMDPVPWSVSKISKWHSKPKPTETPSSTQRPWMNKLESHRPFKYAPQLDDDKYRIYYANEEDLDKPQYSRPTKINEQKVHLQVRPSIIQRPIDVYNGDIIRDDRPSDFPSRYIWETNRRFDPDSNPVRQHALKDGEWVLLSTSKGYRYPRQRSLNLTSVGTRKSVHITVLPPLQGSKVNMTTSHGGLLQVESTFETVEQARRKSQMKKHQMKKRKRPGKLEKRRRKHFLEATVADVPRSSETTENDSSAVLAGVGAGLIPATMAMFVPVAMNG